MECSEWTEDSAEGNESVALAKNGLELVGLGYQLTFSFHVESRHDFTDCMETRKQWQCSRAHVAS